MKEWTMFFACCFSCQLFFSLCKRNMVWGEDVFGTSNSTIVEMCFQLLQLEFHRCLSTPYAMQPSEACIWILRGFENLGYLWCIVPWKRPTKKKLIPIGSMETGIVPMTMVKACFNSNWNTDFGDDVRIKQKNLHSGNQTWPAFSSDVGPSR